MANIKLSQLPASTEAMDNFVFYVVDPSLPEAQRSRKMTGAQLKAYFQASSGGSVTPPPASNLSFTYGLANTATATISNPQTAEFQVGFEVRVTQPAIQDGQYWVYVIPVGYEIVEIKDALFQGLNILPQYTRSGQRWTSRRLNASNGGSYLVTIQEVVNG